MRHKFITLLFRDEAPYLAVRVPGFKVLLHFIRSPVTDHCCGHVSWRVADAAS